MPNALDGAARAALHAVARSSIQYGLRHERPLGVSVQDYPEVLRTPRASFVTLHCQSALRGCVGALEARLPLVSDVAAHAYAAAFQDPRFDPLAPSELAALTIHISVLSPPEPLSCTTEADALRQLKPGVDGVILSWRERHATFLPEVWESLPQPQAFLAQLKRKAGLAEDFWSAEIVIERYSTEAF